MNVLTPQTPEAWNAYVRSFAGWDIIIFVNTPSP